MNSFSIHSFGCRVNQAEAFWWADVFQRHGLKQERELTRSDLVVVNTCTLTSRADREVRSFIRKLSRQNPRAKVLVTGCYAQRAKDSLERNPLVWKVLSNKEKGKLPQKVLSGLQTSSSVPFIPYRSRALVKIQDGCNFGCTFCIIPKVRGKSVSRRKEEILAEVKEYTRQGFQEIVLTGVHLCLYGLDFNPPTSLLRLIREIEEIDTVNWIRLSSLDPRFLDDSLMECLTSSEKICPHFHLSLQHCSEQVLRRMGRRVKVFDYHQTLSCLSQKLPQASLGADIMVGFPGEREEDFEKTRSFLKESPLNYFHVFPYSPRPGTEAFSWTQVEDKIKTERAAQLRRISREKRAQFYKRFIGKEFPAVVIKKWKKGAQLLTPNYLRVIVPLCGKEERGETRVRITGVENNRVKGRIVK